MTVFHQQTATGVCRECGTPHVVGSCPKQRARNLMQAIDRLNTLRRMYDRKRLDAEERGKDAPLSAGGAQ